MKRKIVNLTLVLIVFCIGLTFGKLLNWGYFELTKDISIIDALTLFTTIGVAIYITKILEKEVQESRIEKGLYISKISEFESKLKTIEDLISEKDPSYGKVNSRIHSCRLIKKSIFDSIYGNFKSDKTNTIKDFDRNITNCLSSLKRLLTDTPIITASNSDITLVSGIVNYSSNRIIEVNIEINSILEDLFKLKVRINNL
jgi:hypothetical protein